MDRNALMKQARPLLGPVLAMALVSLAAFLLYRTLSGYSLDELIASVRAISRSHFGLMLASAAGSYFCLTWFDWLALRYVGHNLPYRRAALASFCSLSLGHNIGFAALSSGAIRYRFYKRWGLNAGDVAKVVLFCGVTVGLGLITLGGGAIILRTELASRLTGLPQLYCIGFGILCLSSAAAYAILAAYLRTPLSIRGWRIEMPGLHLALAQLIVGPLNFAFVAGCLYFALLASGEVAYLEVAAAYVIANVTSLISHVPGGLGVIETIIPLLLPGAKVIGGLIAFRAVYFLIPLSLGAPLLGLTELLLKSKQNEP